MMKKENEYNKITFEMMEAIKEIGVLKEHGAVRRYLELCKIIDSLMDKQKELYIELKREEFDSCDHVWVTTRVDYDQYEGRSYHYRSCIKCGLTQEALEKYYYDISLSLDEKIMYDVLRSHSNDTEKNLDVLCDLELARAIFLKIKENHPNIDDELACKYFEIALDNIRNIKVNDTRKMSRAKRLSLRPDFNNWYGHDVYFD